MSLANLVQEVKTILYGTGLGEKPSLRRAAEDAGLDDSGSPIVTFDVLSQSEAEKIKPGNVLSVYGGNDESPVLYVLEVTASTTDAEVTALGGYQGSPIPEDPDLDGVIFEQNPLATDFEIAQNIQIILDEMLWPEVYKTKTATITTPDLVNGQHEVPADVEYIISAWQEVGPTQYGVPHIRQPFLVHTDISSTGKMAKFQWITGVPGRYTYATKIELADVAALNMTRLVATGAAAVTLGGHMVETTIQGTKKDNVEAVGRRQQVGTNLWRDFLTLRTQRVENESRFAVNRLKIDRG